MNCQSVAVPVQPVPGGVSAGSGDRVNAGEGDEGGLGADAALVGVCGQDDRAGQTPCLGAGDPREGAVAGTVPPGCDGADLRVGLGFAVPSATCRSVDSGEAKHPRLVLRLDTEQ